MAAGGERALITGGGGFIGATLTRTLVAAGQDVHLLLRPQANLWRLEGLDGRYTAHRADLLDLAAVRRMVALVRPDIVYHLATHGVYPAQKDRTAILSNNILGTANVLDALDGHDYRALVSAGTAWECGHRDDAIGEDDPLDPRNTYAVAKAAALHLCRTEAHRGRPVVWVRVFSAYGPWEEPGRLVPYVMDCCRRGQPPRVSAGVQLRDFVHVEDVVELLQVAARRAGSLDGTLHAATGRGHTVREMVETILAVSGTGVRAVYGAEPLRPGEPARCLARVERTAERTGWRPRYDLRAGIERTWAWFTSRPVPRAA
jgi:nucleoside-diphosphate-sugar epimerase